MPSPLPDAVRSRYSPCRAFSGGARPRTWRSRTGSDVAYAFIQDALPLLIANGIDLDVFYVSSSELFDLLPADEKEALFPEQRARSAMGITGFTLPTMYRWITSARGRAATLHPFQKGHYLGSGPGYRVLEEAGLDGKSQYRAIKKYITSS